MSWVEVLWCMVVFYIVLTGATWTVINLRAKARRKPMDNESHILEEIKAERQRQDELWGGPDHDDLHTMEDWLWYIEVQRSKARHPQSTAALYRQRLIRIAALAMAAAESYDRKDFERYVAGK